MNSIVDRTAHSLRPVASSLGLSATIKAAVAGVAAVRQVRADSIVRRQLTRLGRMKPPAD